MGLDEGVVALAPSAAPLAPSASSPRPALTPEQQSSRRLAEGVACLVAVSVIWVGASALTQYLFDGVDGVRSPLPFFLTYLNNSEFVLLLPLQWARERYLPHGVQIRGARYFASPASDWRAAARAGLLVCPLWFLAQGSYNASLAGTSVSSSTILSTTSCVFTLVLSALFLGEKPTWVKGLGVALAVAGAALTGLSDETGGGPSDGGEGGGGSSPAASNTGTWWGDALALFSALMYAAYTTAIKRLLPDGEDGPDVVEGGRRPVPMTLFFGFLGLVNTVGLSPVVLALHATGAENLALVTSRFLVLAVFKGLLDNVLADLLWARAIALTSPTLATVALSLTIPLALLSDLVTKGIRPSALLGAGSFLVCLGFVATTAGVDPASFRRLATGASEVPAVVAREGEADNVAARPAAAVRVPVPRRRLRDAVGDDDDEEELELELEEEMGEEGEGELEGDRAVVVR
jgi:solute carrier family 35, member F5